MDDTAAPVNDPAVPVDDTAASVNGTAVHMTDTTALVEDTTASMGDTPGLVDDTAGPVCSLKRKREHVIGKEILGNRKDSVDMNTWDLMGKYTV